MGLPRYLALNHGAVTEYGMAATKITLHSVSGLLIAVCYIDRCVGPRVTNVYTTRMPE